MKNWRWRVGAKKRGGGKMTNNEFLKYLEARIKQEKRKDLKKKLKENFYDKRLNKEGK